METANKMYVTEKEIAEMTGFSVAYLQQARFRGKGMPYIKIGRAVRYVVADVQAWMDAHRVQPVN